MTRTPSVPRILRARRWMLSGLIISIVGTRLVEGGSDGAVAQNILPLVWLGILATVSKGLGFAAPVTARVFSRFNPASVLVASDLAETVLSAAALGALLLAPGQLVPILVGYLALATFFPAITDVVEEFYAQQLAQLGPGHALSFNSSVYSVLGFIGLVLGMPLGSLVSGQSFVLLIALNMVLSAAGVCFRLVSRRTVLTAPVAVQDIEDFGATGTRMSPREFLRDLAGSGAASPGVEFAMSVGRTMAGIFVYLWIAAAMPWPAATSLAVVIACFGIGATLGPQFAPLARRRLSVRASVLFAITAAITTVLIFACCVLLLPPESAWPVALGYVIVMGVFMRMRDVLITTLRQESFRGSRFTRVMSWSFALSSLGALVGSWAAIALQVPSHPLIGLAAVAASLGITWLAVSRLPA